MGKKSKAKNTREHSKKKADRALQRQADIEQDAQVKFSSYADDLTRHDLEREELAQLHFERMNLQKRISEAVRRATEADAEKLRVAEDEHLAEEAEAECTRCTFVAEMLTAEDQEKREEFQRLEKIIMNEAILLRQRYFDIFEVNEHQEFEGCSRMIVQDPVLRCSQIWHYIFGVDQAIDLRATKVVWHPLTPIQVRKQLLEKKFNFFTSQWQPTGPLPTLCVHDEVLTMRRLYSVVRTLAESTADVEDHNAMWHLLVQRGANDFYCSIDAAPLEAWPDESREEFHRNESERLAAETRQNHAATVIQTRWRGVIAGRRAARLYYKRCLSESQEVQQRLALAKQKMEMLENGGHATKGGCVFYAGSAKGARHWSENEQQLGWHPNQTNRPQKVENDVNPLTASNPLEKLCIVCHKNKRNTVCLPCGCLVLCHECSDVITSGKYPNLCKCPHCQRRLEYTVCTVIP